MGSCGKKFKMKIVDCSDPNCLGNESDDSDDEPKIVSKLKVKQTTQQVNHIPT